MGNDAEDTCKKAVVKVDKNMALLCLILNCIPFTSGVGTMVSACINPGEFNTMALVFGLLQLLTAWLLIGWIWSIIHGVWIWQKSSWVRGIEHPLWLERPFILLRALDTCDLFHNGQNKPYPCILNESRRTLQSHSSKSHHFTHLISNKDVQKYRLFIIFHVP